MKRSAPLGEVLRTLFPPQLNRLEGERDALCNARAAESLHDFRVALRRTRALLGELHGLLPIARDYRRALGDLGRQSGRARDLEVFAAQLRGIEAALPSKLHPSLRWLQARLQCEQCELDTRLREVLQGNDCRRLLANWRQLVVSLPQKKRLQKKIGPFADRRLAKAFKLWRRLGRRLQADSPDAQFHALRILSKRLRYLLEFFAPLYPAEPVAGCLAELKALQEQLGRFQDLCVQRALLAELREEEGLFKVRRALCVRLERELAVEQQVFRGSFPELFRQLASGDNCRELRKLLAG